MEEKTVTQGKDSGLDDQLMSVINKLSLLANEVFEVGGDIELSDVSCHGIKSILDEAIPVLYEAHYRLP